MRPVAAPLHSSLMSLRLERPLQEAANWNLHNYCVDYWLIQHTMMTDCLFIFIFFIGVYSFPTFYHFGGFKARHKQTADSD